MGGRVLLLTGLCIVYVSFCVVVFVRMHFYDPFLLVVLRAPAVLASLITWCAGFRRLDGGGSSKTGSTFFQLLKGMTNLLVEFERHSPLKRNPIHT